MDVIEKDVMGIAGSKRITFGGERLVLLADRAVYWERRETLLVADVHLGKGAAFRMAGVPVPAGASAKDLKRLSALIDVTGAKRLVVLGDFIHARSSRQAELLNCISVWRAGHGGVEMKLVRGNHDQRAGRLLEEWSMVEVDAPHEEDGVEFAHFPKQDAKRPMFCGHVHPVFALRDFDGSGARVPCFVVDECCLTLPSFGTFTGGYAVANEVGRRIYITTGKSVVAVPRAVEVPTGAIKARRR